VGKHRHVKLLDFGLVRVVEEDVQLTQQGVIAGTPAYMAPEQAEGQPVDTRCDLFSLGCVLYRCCTGQAPFKGATRNAVLLALAQHQPPSPQTLDAEVPAALSELVMQLLAKEPAARPASARRVAETIEDMERASTELVLPPGVTPVTAEATSGRRRHGVVAVAAAMVLAGLLWLGATVVLRTRHGTLTVTTAEPDITVLVDGQEKMTIDSSTVGKMELVPGEHQLVLKRGAKELYTDAFTLKSGGQVIVAVRWQPRQADKEQDRSPGSSLLDRLDPARIPAEVRAGLPSEVVAVVGDGRLMHWNRVQAMAFSPDGKVLAHGVYAPLPRLEPWRGARPAQAAAGAACPGPLGPAQVDVTAMVASSARRSRPWAEHLESAWVRGEILARHAVAGRTGERRWRCYDLDARQAVSTQVIQVDSERDKCPDRRRRHVAVGLAEVLDHALDGKVLHRRIPAVTAGEETRPCATVDLALDLVLEAAQQVHALLPVGSAAVIA
jgi:hypothetical protein